MLKSMEIDKWKICLVHDWLLNTGGAEKTLKVLHELYPKAPIYTFFHNPKFTKAFLPGADIRPSFLQKYYQFTRRHRWLLPLLPIAAESFDLSAYDLVISSSVGFSKGLITKPQTKHICYCYSPTRWLWDWQSEYRQEHSGWGVQVLQHLMRLWDHSAASRVDQFIAISKTARERIKKYYQAEAEVIYPPVEIVPTDFPIPYSLLAKPYFLIVSRLYSFKNIAIAIEAFNKLKLPLVIVGQGPQYKKLKQLIADPKLIQLVGFVPDEQLGTYYQAARAFIMPQEEDFGLTAIEAMSFGKPVLALRRGGALEYIMPGINGEYFDDPLPEILADGVRRLNENYKNYSPLVIKKTAEKFSRRRFQKEVTDMILNWSKKISVEVGPVDTNQPAYHQND